MKTYVITLSQVFPAGHSQAGEPTNFKFEFLLGQQCSKCPPRDRNKNYVECDNCMTRNQPKIHTMRANYPLWEKRIAKVQAGQAILSIRQWTGKPYHSPQVEIARLTSEDSVGIQKLTFCGALSRFKIENGINIPLTDELAQNDGLSLVNWVEWFKGYDLSKPMAIIHFTKFRY